MLDIYNIFNERIKYPLSGRDDAWLDKIKEQDLESFDVLIPVSMFFERHQLSLYGELLEKYNIKCLLKIKSLFCSTDIYFNLISLQKNMLKKLLLVLIMINRIKNMMLQVEVEH